MSDTEKPDLAQLTVQLLSSYFSNNTVPASDIASIIQTTRTALAGETAPPVPVVPEHVPAVSARKSLSSPDHIVSMIDGKPYKMLKRHLATNGLTPAEYRERYKLPKTYPMVAPSYAEQRRAVAAKIGLGQRKPAPKPVDAPAPTEAAPAPVVAEAPAKAAVAPTKRTPARKASAPAKTAAKAAPKAAAAKATTPKAESAAKKPAAPKATASKKAPAKAAARPKRAKADAPAVAPVE